MEAGVPSLLSKPRQLLPKHQILHCSPTFPQRLLPEVLQDVLAKLQRFQESLPKLTSLSPPWRLLAYQTKIACSKAEQSLGPVFAPGCGVQRTMSSDRFTAQGQCNLREDMGTKTNAKTKWGAGKFSGIKEGGKRVAIHSNKIRKIITTLNGQRVIFRFPLGYHGPTTVARR